MADNDDLMIEVTGSSNKAASALDKIIEKVSQLQKAIEQATPSLSKFTEKLDSITAGSKAFAMLAKLSNGTNDVALASKKAEAAEAMYQARIERSIVSMERSRIASEKLAAARRKMQEYAAIDAHNQAAFSMSPEEFKRNFDHTVTETPTETVAPEVNAPTAPSMKYNVASLQAQMDAFTAKIAGKTPKINIDAEAATAEVRKIGEYIDGLKPKVSLMSSEAQAKFNSLAATLTLVSQRIDNQKMVLREYLAESGRVAKEYGEGSKQYLLLEKRILSATSSLNGLMNKQEKLKTQLAEIGSEATKSGDNNEKAAKKSTRAWGNFLRMMEGMLIRIAAFRLYSAASQGITTGLQNMAQASGTANNTMSALATSSLYLKNSFASALMPAIQAITPSIVWLTTQLANLFNTLGMLGARVFGGATSFTVAKIANVNYAETLNKAGDSASNAAKKVKELKNSVMGFDELNKLTEPTSSAATPKNKNPGMPSPGAMFQDVKIPTGIQTLGDKVKSFFGEWAKYAEPARAALDRLWQRLEPFRTFVAKGVSDFYNDFLKPLGIWTLGTAFPTFCNIVGSLANGIDWASLNKALDTLWKALEPFAETIGNGLLWFIGNVLEPLTAWAMNNIAPAALNLVTNAIKLADSTCQALKPTGEWLLNTFLKPLAAWTGKAVVDALNTVSGALQKISTWISNNKSTVDGMAKTVLAFFAAWKVTELLSFIETSGGVINALKAITTAIIGGTTAKIADKAQTIALKVLYAGDFLKSIVSGTEALVKQIAQWATLKAAKIADIIQTGAQTAATKLATLAQGALNIVLNANPIALIVVGITALVTAFVVLYNKCAWFRNGWNAIWSGIGYGFKTFVNGLIWGLNKIIDGINYMIRGLNKIHFSTPDWIPFIGGQSFGISIGYVSNIPYLASGALVTGPTQAVIGEGADHEAVLPLNDKVFSQIAQGIVRNGGNSSFDADIRNQISEISKQIAALKEAILSRPVKLYTDDRIIAESAERGRTQLARQYHSAE